MSKVQTIVCCSKFYQNDFRDKAKAPRREALASYNSSTSMKYFKMFIICEICPADHLKVGEKGLQRQFPRFLQFCVIFLYLKFGAMNFFLSTCTRKGTNMFNGPTNLRKFHPRKRHKSCSKDPYFLCRKTLRNGIELL